MVISPFKRTLILVIFALFATVNMVRVLQLYQENFLAGGDYYDYWYAGQILRQQGNPYLAYVEPESFTIKTPVDFIYGETANRIPPNPSTSLHGPTNFSPILFLVSPFSYLAWAYARYVWLGFNFILIVFIPWLLYKTFPNRRELGRSDLLFFALSLVALSGTRNSLSQGQFVLLYLTLTIVSVWCWEKNRPILAGLALGFLLSKISFGLPIAILFLLAHQWKSLTIAVLVQLAGLVAVSMLSHTSPIETVMAHLEIIRLHTASVGIHLGYWFPYGDLIAIVLTLPLGIYLATILGNYDLNRHSWLRLQSVALGFLWVFNIGYHNRGDTAALFILFAILWAGSRTNLWGFSPQKMTFLLMTCTVVMMILSLPIFDSYITDHVGKLGFAINNLTLIGMLLLAVWLIGQKMRIER